MKTEAKVALGACIVAIVISTAMAFVPTPATWSGDYASFHWPLIANALMATLHVGAAILFLMGLSVYKAKLRRAYIAIALSIVLIAIGTLQVTVANGYDLLHTAWVRNGGLGLPFLLGGTIGYFGTRKLATLISLKSMVTNIWLIFPIVIICSILSILLPHVPVHIPEIPYDIANAITVWTGLFIFGSVLLVFGVQKHIGEHYMKAMRALTLALFASFVIIICVLIHSLAFTTNYDMANILLNSLEVLAGLLWIRAGYMFIQTKDY